MSEQENIIETNDNTNLPTSENLETFNTAPSEGVVVADDNVNIVGEKSRKSKRKIERDVYALASENEALRQKNADMEDLLQKSLDAGNYHYGTVAMGLLDKAKQNLAKALGEGDVDAVATATAEIAQATSVINEAKRATPIYPQEDRVSNNGRKVDTADAGLLYDWLDDNPDFDKDSPVFNENLTNQVLPFITKLENRLKRNNQTHLIASPEYFNIIDEYVEKIKDNKENVGKHFGSVRSRQQPTNVSEKKIITLTNQQKKAAAAFNMSEEKYINYLQQYAKEGKK